VVEKDIRFPLFKNSINTIRHSGEVVNNEKNIGGGNRRRTGKGGNKVNARGGKRGKKFAKFSEKKVEMTFSKKKKEGKLSQPTQGGSCKKDKREGEIYELDTKMGKDPVMEGKAFRGRAEEK